MAADLRLRPRGHWDRQSGDLLLEICGQIELERLGQLMSNFKIFSFHQTWFSFIMHNRRVCHTLNTMDQWKWSYFNAGHYVRYILFNNSIALWYISSSSVEWHQSFCSTGRPFRFHFDIHSSFLARHIPYEFYLIHNQYPSEHATALLCVFCCKLQSQIDKLPRNQIEWIKCDIVDFKGARGGAVGWGTALQPERSRVRIPVVP